MRDIAIVILVLALAVETSLILALKGEPSSRWLWQSLGVLG